MDQSPEELEQKAAKYRQVAWQVGDQETAESILALAQNSKSKPDNNRHSSRSRAASVSGLFHFH
jgi:hypothetical protein